MQNEFLIVDRGSDIGLGFNGLELLIEGDFFSIYGNSGKNGLFGKVKVIIDGYVLPNNSSNKEQISKNQAELINELYTKHGDNFTNYIKGLFTIIIVDNGTVKIFNDQLGVNKFFYFTDGNQFCFSNSYKLIVKATAQSGLNSEALATKALLNREVNGQTLFSNIYYSVPATKVVVTKDSVNVSKYWDISLLLNNSTAPLDIEYFANLFKGNISNYNQSLKPEKTALTLTGGKDSRTALTALLNAGVSPVGVTYGNPETIDSVFASKLAAMAGIEHVIYNPTKTEEWFEVEANNIVELNNPLINIHRSHRLYAIRMLAERLGNNTSFYTGYMGGELLMGVYFDNLIFTNFIRDFWIDGSSQFNKIPALLQDRFIKTENLDIGLVKEQLGSLKTFDESLGKKGMQFHSLFEIGVLHHSQDIQIAQHFLDYPLPFFLDFEFVNALFSSQYSFLHRNVETKNLIKRHSLFEFNLKLQHIFYPALDKAYYAKKGTYNTSEFLRGPLYWSAIKAMRYFMERKKYPPTFSYGQSYISFLNKYLNEIALDTASPINDIYNVPLALKSLKEQENLTTESTLHRYSNIVMHYMQYCNYTKQP